MSDLKKLMDAVVSFRDERDWKQFHNPKDVALSLVLEAVEVMEHFQWKTKKEIDTYLKESKGEVADELADVLYWVLLMSNDLDIDIYEAFMKKLKDNNKKYPIEKAKGKHTKYSKL